MQAMIKEYQKSKALVMQRIHELNAELANNEALGTKERDMLMLRRDILTTESIELLHAIVSMQGYCRKLTKEERPCQ